MSRRTIMLAIASTAMLSGCTYYEITDPATGKSYYTNNWDLKEFKDTSVTRFKSHDGTRVALDEYERKTISKQEFLVATEVDESDE